MIDLQKTDKIHLEVKFDGKRLLLLWNSKDDFAIVQAECTKDELSHWLADNNIPININPGSFNQIGKEVSYKIAYWRIPHVLSAVGEMA